MNERESIIQSMHAKSSDHITLRSCLPAHRKEMGFLPDALTVPQSWSAKIWERYVFGGPEERQAA